jgi:Gram-negative bacterial TonB protein C-terminal
MQLRLRLAKALGYPLRPSSFAISLCVHSAIVTLIMALSTYHPARVIVREEIFPLPEHRILLYDFRKKTPEVKPAIKFGSSPTPRAVVVAQKTIIATSPKALSEEQLIVTPMPKVVLPKDLPLPNLIATVRTAPPPEEAKPIPEPPPAPKTPPRAFVPPVKQPKLPLPQVQLAALDPPDALPVNAVPVPNPSTGSRLSLPVVAAPGPVAKPGENVEVAIASLHPTTAKSEIPAGARGGKFSEAPDKGAPASGDLSRSGVTVPNLTMREEKPKVIPPETRSGKSVLYSDKVRGAPISTLSVPLRPSNRTIPRAIDLRFQGRSVYTMVVPIENLPAYSSDWIIWFAEHEPKLGTAPSVRAPIPYRKFEMIAPEVSGARTEQRIQIAAVIKPDGRLEDISVLNRATPDASRAALQDLALWEFKPASRDGAPVAVDVVIEIPFSFPPSIVTRTQ